MGLIVGFAVAVALTPAAAWTARRLGIVDRPGPLKVHRGAIPYLGGAAVFAGVAGPVALHRPLLLAPLGLALALGIADDATDLSFHVRLPIEVAIGATAALVVPSRGPVGALLTAGLVIALLNAVNLLDGLDGLASGVALMSALGLAAVLDSELRVLALGLAGALAGFLVWNRPPARIFLGDGGSYLVGTALAMLLAGAFADGEPVAIASGALLMVAVPVADTAVAILRRVRAGQSLFEGDRGHVYDQLVDRGWAPVTVVGVCIGVQALLAFGGFGIAFLPGAAAIGATATVVAVVGCPVLAVFSTPRAWPRWKTSAPGRRDRATGRPWQPAVPDPDGNGNGARSKRSRVSRD